MEEFCIFSCCESEFGFPRRTLSFFAHSDEMRGAMNKIGFTLPSVGGKFPSHYDWVRLPLLLDLPPTTFGLNWATFHENNFNRELNTFLVTLDINNLRMNSSQKIIKGACIKILIPALHSLANRRIRHAPMRIVIPTRKWVIWLVSTGQKLQYYLAS